MQVVIMPYAEELWQCIRAASMHGAHQAKKGGIIMHSIFKATKHFYQLIFTTPSFFSISLRPTRTISLPFH